MRIKFRRVEFPKDEGKYLYLHKNGYWYVKDFVWQNGDLGYIKKVGENEIFLPLNRVKDHVVQWYWMKGA